MDVQKLAAKSEDKGKINIRVGLTSLLLGYDIKCIMVKKLAV